MSEIFPTRIREGGIAIGTATQWLFNFVLSQITPHAIDNLGYKTFVMFSVFNFALVVYSFFIIKETKGRSLEEMEIRKSTMDSPNFMLKSSIADFCFTVFNSKKAESDVERSHVESAHPEDRKEFEANH